jgi:hypothetical protein
MVYLRFAVAAIFVISGFIEAVRAQVPDHNCEMPRPGTPAYSNWLLHGFQLPRAPLGYYYPQGSCTAIPIASHDRSSSQLPQRLAAQNETLESDQAWEREITNGPCSRLRDRRTDSPADIATCKSDYASQPKCLDYKASARIWWDMRKTHDVAFQYQPQILASMGSGVDEIAVHHSAEHKARLQRLLTAVQTMDQSKWKSASAFADVAYKQCMDGNFF